MSPQSSLLKPLFRAVRQGRWKRFLLLFLFFFSSPIFFPFQLQRDPKWSLEMAMSGCPEKSCPHSPVQSSSFFLLSPCQGEGGGASSHCVLSPLRCQSHDKGLPPSPNSLHIVSTPASQCLMASQPQKAERQLGRLHSHFVDEEPSSWVLPRVCLPSMQKALD